MTLGYLMRHITLPINLFYTCHSIITYRLILTTKVMYKFSTCTHVHAHANTHKYKNMNSHTPHTCTHARTSCVTKPQRVFLLPLSQSTLKFSFVEQFVNSYWLVITQCWQWQILPQIFFHNTMTDSFSSDLPFQAENVCSLAALWSYVGKVAVLPQLTAKDEDSNNNQLHIQGLVDEICFAFN